MSKFPKDFGPDVEVEEVDLDATDVRFRGNNLTEARAEEVAADIVSRTPGRPALSGPQKLRPTSEQVEEPVPSARQSLPSAAPGTGLE